MSSTALSFQADEEIVQTLDQLAGATGRDRQYHLQRALSRYLEAEMRQMQAVSDGIADADAGNLTDIESVKARWVKRAHNSPDSPRSRGSKLALGRIQTKMAVHLLNLQQMK